MHDLLYANQFGLRHKHSTIAAVTKLITNTCKTSDENEATLAVYLDLLKVFDTIDHSILPIKHIMPKRQLSTHYYSLIYPYLTYGIILWGATCHVHLSKLIIMLKKVSESLQEHTIGHINTKVQIPSLFQISRLISITS